LDLLHSVLAHGLNGCSIEVTATAKFALNGKRKRIEKMLFKDFDMDIICENHDDSDVEHYESLVQLKRYQWIGKDGQIEDLRYIQRKNVIYAINILCWMHRHHTDNIPYRETEQFDYLFDKIIINFRKRETVKGMFKHERTRS
jgi:hypothetical protein